MTVPDEVITERATDLPVSTVQGPRVDRVVIGGLLGTIGIWWILDEAGVSVPWRLLPAATVTAIGIALLITLIGGRGRGVLVGLGVAALLVAIAVGVGADRYAGPAGDRLVAPVAAAWPVENRVSAGNVTVDLTQHQLPVTGHLEVNVGAGEITLILPPDDEKISVDAWTTAGTVTVDGVKVGDGIDVRWAQTAAIPAPVTVELHVGMGNIEVSHE